MILRLGRLLKLKVRGRWMMSKVSSVNGDHDKIKSMRNICRHHSLFYDLCPVILTRLTNFFLKRGTID